MNELNATINQLLYLSYLADKYEIEVINLLPMKKKEATLCIQYFRRHQQTCPDIFLKYFKKIPSFSYI